jgi:thiol:disulfide interchange protein DsbD
MAPRRPDNAPPLEDVDPEEIVRRGMLRFVSDFDRARDLAADRGLPQLVYFTASWCSFCREMEASAFYDRDVVNLADRFICTLVDGDRETSLKRRFKVAGFPTILLSSREQEPVTALVGVQSAEELVAALRSAL